MLLAAAAPAPAPDAAAATAARWAAAFLRRSAHVRRRMCWIRSIIRSSSRVQLPHQRGPHTHAELGPPDPALRAEASLGQVPRLVEHRESETSSSSSKSACVHAPGPSDGAVAGFLISSRLFLTAVAFAGLGSVPMRSRARRVRPRGRWTWPPGGPPSQKTPPATPPRSPHCG